MKIIYIDPVFGISGDMMISALIDAGVPFEELEALIAKIPGQVPTIGPVRLDHDVFDGIHLEIGPSDRHFTINGMVEIISGIDTEKRVKDDALGMLSLIVSAESKIHGVSRDELHLHELSHIDTVIDLLCVAYGIRYFDAEKVFCGPVPCGSGTIRTSHGMIPNPPPVTLEILGDHRIVPYEDALELTTPTGAAIVAHYVQPGGAVPAFRTLCRGHGMGTYVSSRPDVLRVFVGESDGPLNDEEVWVIETDIDDMEMEYMGAIAGRIRDAGALDVLFFPVLMKKGRMGIRLSVTADLNGFEDIVELIFAETTTFGMRFHKDSRRVLGREEAVMTTSHGQVRVKKGFDRAGKLVKTHIEFEDVRAIADEKDLPYREVLELIRNEIKNSLKV